MGDICVKHNDGTFPERCPYCEIEALKAERNNKEMATLQAVDFAVKRVVENVVCDKPTVKVICEGIKNHFNLNHKEG